MAMAASLASSLASLSFSYDSSSCRPRTSCTIQSACSVLSVKEAVGNRHKNTLIDLDTAIPSTCSLLLHQAKKVARYVVARSAEEPESLELAAEEPALNPAKDSISALKMQSDLLKKKKKREELRRKRLVRKRHLRKKGRWPPSKLAKTKNV